MALYLLRERGLETLRLLQYIVFGPIKVGGCQVHWVEPKTQRNKGHIHNYQLSFSAPLTQSLAPELGNRKCVLEEALNIK